MQNQDRPCSRDGFEIAIICALALEANAVFCSLDEIWHDAPSNYGKATGDSNNYAFGRIGRHPVVVVTLPGMGNVRSAHTAASLGMSFVSIQLALLVGICGSVPCRPDGQEIILGDVIVSEVLVRLDFGRQYPSGFKRKDTILDSPGKPNEEILGLLQRWKSRVMAQQLHANMIRHLNDLMQHSQIGTGYPTSTDQLFASDYIHKHHFGCVECGLSDRTCDLALNSSCEELGCDERRLVSRVRRSRWNAQDSDNQQIHFGSIGTADMVMKSAWHRDQIALSEGIIAFEMEGAGIWDKFNCLIVKGVCDYADSHKNKKWQVYAATVAAATAKEILRQYVPCDRPGSSHPRAQYSPQNVHFRHSLPESQIHEASADGSPLSEILKRTVKDFRKHVTDDQFETFRATELLALKRELKRMQDEQHRARQIKNMTRVKDFMEKIEAFGTIVHDILGSNEVECLLWGSAKALFRTTRDHADLLDSLLSAYEELGSEIPSLGGSRQAFYNHRGFQRLLGWILSDVMAFHADAFRIYSGRALKTVFKSLWKDYEFAFKNTLRRMRSYKAIIEDRIRDTYIDPRQASIDMSEIRRLLQQVEKDKFDFEKEENKRQNRNFHAVRDWIAAADAEAVHSDICRDPNRSQDSGSWILEKSPVKHWLHAGTDESSEAMLWINGRPGAGKTYLAYVIIEACLKETDFITCYFYCSEKAESSASAMAILRGILLQLVCRHDELIPYCYAKMKSSTTSILSDFSTANALLDTFCERLSKCYIVIDGLDECGEGRKRILETFKNLVRKTSFLSPGKIRVAFLSQPSLEIKKLLPEAQVFALEPDNTNDDIKNYCRYRSRELVKFDFDDEILDNVIDRVCIRADGIFLFAKLVMENLASQPNRRRFKDEIDAARLPSELNEAYARIMERLKKDLSEAQMEYTTLLLAWLVCSKRPLKWNEIQVALTIDLRSSTISHELHMDLKLRDDVQELCGSLVQVLHGNRIELVHSTAKLFVVQHSKINVQAAECDLTLRCLRYLTLDIFHQNIPESNLLEYTRRGDLAFQDYAVSQWPMHMRTFVEAKQAFLEGSAPLRGTDSYTQVDLICREFENFVHFYSQNLRGDRSLQSSLEDCVFFDSYPFHGPLVRIWSHVCLTQQGDSKAMDLVSLESLEKTLTRNRKQLEKLSSDPAFDYPQVYDEYPFRCPKVLCFYFHEGFRNADVRDNHVNHHDLPFQCPVTTCQHHTFGLRSKSALTSHMLKYHPEECDLDELFTPLNKRKIEATKYQCTYPDCGRFFTRSSILGDHLRATHRGEKPFCCSECGRGFGRQNDRTRHEKIHDRNRR